MKNLKRPIEYRTSDLPACSAVSRPDALPQTSGVDGRIILKHILSGMRELFVNQSGSRWKQMLGCC
jgi:hypothetical protein